VDKKDISWKSDREHKFGKDVFPSNFQDGSLIGGASLNPKIPVCESYSTPPYVITYARHRETTVCVTYICKGDILTSDKINYVSIVFFSLVQRKKYFGRTRYLGITHVNIFYDS
jgi:hypothetical protein